MRRQRLQIVYFLIGAMLAAPATTLWAQQAGIRWQQDLEAAKTLARQTGRLVLIHFWTPDCAPCVTLDQTVFNQPGVAGAIDAQFVPVKLNANENPATAQGYGITRVPTDVIVTPDGAVVGRLVSPPTPSAYVAEVTQVARDHSSTPGTPFARATAAPPTPPQINAAYANLPLAPNTPPVAGQPNISDNAPAAGLVSRGAAAGAPLTSENQFAPPPLIGVAAPSSPPMSPPATSSIASPPPSQVTNRYVASPPAPALVPVSPGVPAQPAHQPQVSSAVTPIAAPDPKHLPPGAPPLGFDGYCPVSMRNQWKWVPGDPQWGIVHRGRTYWFASENEQQQFWSDPDRYSPALSGMDPVMAMDHQQQVPGKREHSIDYDNLFYMFCSEATLQQFTANPERYATGVREAMGIPRGRLVR